MSSDLLLSISLVSVALLLVLFGMATALVLKLNRRATLTAPVDRRRMVQEWRSGTLCSLHQWRDSSEPIKDTATTMFHCRHHSCSSLHLCQHGPWQTLGGLFCAWALGEASFKDGTHACHSSAVYTVLCHGK